MALKNEILQKHLNLTKKAKKQYSQFKAFDDPDYQKKLATLETDLTTANNNDNPTNLKNHSLQNRHKIDTNDTQNRHKIDTNDTQNRHKIDTKYDTKIDTNDTQNRHKIDTKYDTNSEHKNIQKITLNTLVGKQKKLLLYIYEICKMQGTKTTQPLNIENISEHTFIEKGSIKTSLARLIQKNFLIKTEAKKGRSGWVVLKIPDLVYQELFNNNLSLSQTQNRHKIDTNDTQNRHKIDTKCDTKCDTTTPIVVSSYIYNNKLLTTTALPEEYKTLDFSCLTNIGFDESHVIQIHREYSKKPELALSPEIIQNSINAFAFDLKHNNTSTDFKSSPAVVLTSLLKKGQPYSSKTPEKVLTPQEEAMQEYFLAQNKKQQKILELEIKTKELALQEWLNLLPEEELLNFNQDPRPEGMPERLYELSKKRKALEFAKDYFNTVLWPEKLKQILSKVNQESKPQEQIPT